MSGQLMGWPSWERRARRAALTAALATETGIMLMNALRPWAENRLIAWYYADSFREEH